MKRAPDAAGIPQAAADLPGSRQVDKTEWRRGEISTATDRVVAEVPVALVYNGISHVVMMATPVGLEDFALGFSLSEGILESADELLDCVIAASGKGIELQLTILASRFAGLKEKRRNLTGRTGCGLCGAESLEQAIVMPPPVTRRRPFSHAALDAAAGSLRHHQPLQAATGASHGAAWCDGDGNIRLVREDVGRHNALDKLLGALALSSAGPGFALVSSRASYEMVAKAARFDISLLVSVSAPTSLAVEMASTCGMTLAGFAQPGRHVVYTGELTPG